VGICIDPWGNYFGRDALSLEKGACLGVISRDLACHALTPANFVREHQTYSYAACKTKSRAESLSRKARMTFSSDNTGIIDLQDAKHMSSSAWKKCDVLDTSLQRLTRYWVAI